VRIKESSLQTLGDLLTLKKGNDDINSSPSSIMPGNVFWQALLIARIILPWVAAKDIPICLACMHKEAQAIFQL